MIFLSAFVKFSSVGFLNSKEETAWWKYSKIKMEIHTWCYISWLWRIRIVWSKHRSYIFLNLLLFLMELEPFWIVIIQNLFVSLLYILYSYLFQFTLPFPLLSNFFFNPPLFLCSSLSIFLYFLLSCLFFSLSFLFLCFLNLILSTKILLSLIFLPQ